MAVDWETVPKKIILMLNLVQYSAIFSVPKRDLMTDFNGIVSHLRDLLTDIVSQKRDLLTDCQKCDIQTE